VCRFFPSFDASVRLEKRAFGAVQGSSKHGRAGLSTQVEFCGTGILFQEGEGAFLT